MDFRKLFHKISYVQYPLMLIGLYYAVLPYITGFDTLWSNLNYTLIFMGLGVTFSTFQDTTKTQNEVSRKIWESPKKGRRFIILMGLTAVFILVIGFIGLYVEDSVIPKDLSLGIIVLGIGLLGQLKVAMEMFENHRLDKNIERKQ